METKTTVVVGGDTLMVVGPLTAEAAKGLVGQRFEMDTKMANGRDWYTVESVSHNRDTGDWTAWVTRPGKTGGRHARIVAKS